MFTLAANIPLRKAYANHNDPVECANVPGTVRNSNDSTQAGINRAEKTSMATSEGAEGGLC